MANELQASAKQLADSLRVKAKMLKSANFENVRDGLVEAMGFIANDIESRATLISQMATGTELLGKLVSELKARNVL